MRLPYLQVAMEVLEQTAPDLAVELECDEAHVFWGLAKLFRWGLGRCADDAPPSVHSLVTGPNAARLIAKAAGYQGDPEAYATALCAVSPDPVLERTPQGIRLCGLNRYDAAWGKSNKDVWPAWKAFLDGLGPDPRRIRSESVPKAERKLSENSPKAVPQTQTQTQTHEKQQHPPRADDPFGGIKAPPSVLKGAEPGRRADEQPNANDTLEDRAKALWKQKRGREPSDGWCTEFDLRAAFDKAKQDEAEFLRVFAAALDRTEYPKLHKFTDLLRFWDTYAATRGPEPSRPKSPNARATDADKVRPGYEPRLTDDGQIDLTGAA